MQFFSSQILILSWRNKVRSIIVRYFCNSISQKFPDEMKTIKGASCLEPPTLVRGMKVLNKTAFSKIVQVPYIRFGSDFYKAIALLKPYLLKLDSLKPVQEAEGEKGMKDVLLNPDTVKTFGDLQENIQDQLKELGLKESDFKLKDITLAYDNWKADIILKAVLPEEATNVTGYSLVGHIIHLNLKDEHLEFKNIIGEVLLDKNSNVRSVVNKLNTIDNTYRNFSMEILAGEQDTHVLVKENGCHFEFDFAKVYWNSRLQKEHERLISKLKPYDTLFDVFAGVGPFAIPAGRKKCSVYANDLNPDSSKWLSHNSEKNRVSRLVHVYTLDGRDFLRNIVKVKLLEIWRSDDIKRGIHIVMNLPALATQFLDVFPKLLEDEEIDVTSSAFSLPQVHCYCFVKDAQDFKAEALSVVEDCLGCKLGENLQEVCFVRNVAPNKEMLRVSFQLSYQILFGHSETNEHQAKKMKIS